MKSPYRQQEMPLFSIVTVMALVSVACVIWSMSGEHEEAVFDQPIELSSPVPVESQWTVETVPPRPKKVETSPESSHDQSGVSDADERAGAAWDRAAGNRREAIAK